MARIVIFCREACSVMGLGAERFKGGASPCRGSAPGIINQELHNRVEAKSIFTTHGMLQKLEQKHNAPRHSQSRGALFQDVGSPTISLCL